MSSTNRQKVGRWTQILRASRIRRMAMHGRGLVLRLLGLAGMVSRGAPGGLVSGLFDPRASVFRKSREQSGRHSSGWRGSLSSRTSLPPFRGGRWEEWQPRHGAELVPSREQWRSRARDWAALSLPLAARALLPPHRAGTVRIPTTQKARGGSRDTECLGPLAGDWLRASLRARAGGRTNGRTGDARALSKANAGGARSGGSRPRSSRPVQGRYRQETTPPRLPDLRR